MKGCHNCPVADEIAAGVYENAAWDETPCATCDVMGGSGLVLEFDETRGPGIEDRCPRADDEEGGAYMIPLDTLGEILKGLLLLPAAERDAMAMRFAGLKYREIAEAQGVTMGCVEKRHRTAMKRWPELRELFPCKAKKQLRRKGGKKTVMKSDGRT